MAWRDELQQGSFRGVPFDYESGDAGIGRRIQLTEYPLRDKPFAEDLGRKAREFTLNVFVIGDDYMDRRDALIGAIETEGPGTLVHPRLGSLEVTVTACRGPRESTREGGIARFAITFVEAGERVFPSELPDTPQLAQTQATVSREVLQSSFASSFDVQGVPGFVASAGESQSLELFDRLQGLASFAPTVPSEVTGFLSQIETAKLNVATLIRKPQNWASTVGGLFGRVSRIFVSPNDALGAARNVATFGRTRASLPLTTATRQRQATNQLAIDSFARRQALVEAVTSASRTPFPSRADAERVRESLAVEFDTEMDTASDEEYVALADLRVAMIRDLTERGANLAQLVQYTPYATVPSLVVAYQLYGTIEPEAELLARNRVRYPGFLPGGEPLEVLTDAV